MGRKLLKREIPKEFHDKLKHQNVQKISAITVKNELVICCRCGSKLVKESCEIKNKLGQFFYCSECLIMGRVESRLNFYSVKETKNSKRAINFTWQGKLTKEQNNISKKLVESFKKKRNHLVHAVTGAGKTEMLFPLIKYTLSKGCRMAVVSPRVDVCLELFPRFQKVFPDEEMMLLYGKKEESYRYTSFVVATTHQLLRFSEAFDLIVVDEVDAFPFAGNPVLAYGVQQALKKQGRLVYLTATPSEELTQEIKQKKLAASYLAKRYHGYQLPVPHCTFDYFLTQKLAKNKLSSYFLQILQKQNRQCLIFFANIERMKVCYQELVKKFPEKKIAYVYAGKSDREELILAMRAGKIDWLLTTTILERGVTFPNIDVIVFEADHRVFNRASLVQISGRVGRKKEFPTGNVYFLHTGKTKAINQAIRQIKEMNQKAGFS